MGINKKGKRTFIHNGTRYCWSINRDYDDSSLSIIAEDKSVMIKYYFNQVDQKDSPSIFIERSPKLKSGFYRISLHIADIIMPSIIKDILAWYDNTERFHVVKHSYRYPHKNVLTELDFRGGKIDFINAEEDALYNLSDIVGDTLIAVSYPNKVKLSVSWNGAREGFVIATIMDENWNKPLKILQTNFTGEVLKAAIQEVIDFIVKGE